jgi:hypothetical protein
MITVIPEKDRFMRHYGYLTEFIIPVIPVFAGMTKGWPEKVKGLEKCT